MEKLVNNITNEDFLMLLENALFDKKINNYEFKILVYIFKNSDFLIADIKTQLNISSFNAISKYIKNLIKEKYIIRESKHIKNQKSISQYLYYINTEKMKLQESNTNVVFSPLYDSYTLYYYFFDKIPTTKRIDKSINLKQINLLIDFDKYDIEYLKLLIDFVSLDENLKHTFNRPILFRKSINLIIELYNENQNKNISQNKDKKYDYNN